MDDFEDRLNEKLNKDSMNTSRGRSPGGFASSSSSSWQMDDFEARIAAKSKEGNMSRSRDESPGTAMSYEDRLKKKLDEGNQKSARRLRGNSQSSFEDRLNEKLNKDSMNTSRGRSPGAIGASSSSSSRQMDDFEARIAAKSKEGNKS